MNDELDYGYDERFLFISNVRRLKKNRGLFLVLVLELSRKDWLVGLHCSLKDMALEKN